ncbi:respiratory burst oxidase-like protein B [Pyrus ussuriensis x Pyrus communis]|uniref:Respiratory burst oxidase-like protein B n=1 Tax=Pyrus ussuriensis x Pyrus communis TaxID=2448454 RepID=A0A5N5I8Q8_9ROSA|nr:respiratory burst oxidase-like protein B [Pyrus ussuriensis x Pyrus communis]
MKLEVSELPKSLVLGRDRNIHIRLTGSTSLGNVGCYNSLKCIKSEFYKRNQYKKYWSSAPSSSFPLPLYRGSRSRDGRDCEAKCNDRKRQPFFVHIFSNRLSNIQERAEEYAALIMEELDPDNIGHIDLYNLEMLLLQDPIQSTNLATDNRVQSQLLSQKLVPTKEHNPLRRWYRRLAYFMEDNWRRILVIALWISICLGLYTWKFVQYKNRAVFDVMGYCVSTAKGGAETLKFNTALILLPQYGNTKLGVVPFDDNINFHKVIAFGILVGVGLHADSHLTCDFPRLLHFTDNEYKPMKPFFGTKRPDDFWWFMRGTETKPWFRRNRLTLPKTLKKLIFVITWMYLAVPILLYACERLIRAFRSRYETVKISKLRSKVAVYLGNVLALHHYWAIYLCEDISPFQWHPFSVTSAPGDDYINRPTSDLHCRPPHLFLPVPPLLLDNHEPPLVFDDFQTREPQTRIEMPGLLIDGPYVAPAQDYKKYEALLLVGLGIGATPLISILKDVLSNNIKHQKEVEDNQGIKYNKRTFGVMNEVAGTHIDGVIELHNYCTRAYEEGDARSALTTMLQSLNHAKNGINVVSGTRVKTHFPRSNYIKFVFICPFAEGVFYCGAHGSVGELKRLAQDFSRKTETKFDFHEENF